MVALDQTQVITLMVLFGVNLVIGLALALKSGELEVAKLADILGKRIIPYGFGYVVMGWLTAAAPDMAVAQGLTFAGIVAAMVGHIYKQAAELLGIGQIDLLKK